MKGLAFRSRAGNIALAAFGAIYVLAALALLVWYVVTTWPAAHLLDVILQFGLFCAALVGIGFVALAKPRISVRARR